jgi:hypothetical protein
MFQEAQSLAAARTNSGMNRSAKRPFPPNSELAVARS